MAKSKYVPECFAKISKKQWAKWSLLEQTAFNYVYDFMINNQKLFLHPKAVVNKDEHWQTTAFNAAWAAADGARDGMEVIKKYRII